MDQQEQQEQRVRLRARLAFLQERAAALAVRARVFPLPFRRSHARKHHYLSTYYKHSPVLQALIPAVGCGPEEHDPTRTAIQTRTTKRLESQPPASEAPLAAHAEQPSQHAERKKSKKPRHALDATRTTTQATVPPCPE